MIINIGTLQAKPGMEKELEEMLLAMVEKAAPEEGLVTYTLHRAKDDPGKFLFYETYKDRDALEYHASRPHVAEFMKIIGKFVSGSSMNFYEVISSVEMLRK